ncbi:innexin unc-9-like [Saccostrea echinata]|uniref:innexin unc-9-like n=1 Tax=Saccostrea echinata TaxID=191078 RepID=UPI002A829CFD|nr:innexin unc-9-like [Saccostrea echinata]
MDKKIEQKDIKIAANTGDYTLKLRLFGHGHDDWIDRLNNVIVPTFLILFTVFTGTEHHFTGPPIHCWCPAEFTDTYVAYVNYFCWIRNTYYIPLNQPITEEARENEVMYYQWVPLMLVIMALLFKIPNILWRLFHKGSGIQLDIISQKAADTQTKTWDERNQTVKNVASVFQRWERIRIPLNKSPMFLERLASKRSGYYLASLYIVKKCLYCANVIGQFFLLDEFLGHDFYLQYGLDIFGGTVGNSTVGLARFPRVTMCDVHIRQLQNLLRWTVQCVLPLNMYNEKMFVFLWFLCGLVAFLTCASLLIWIWRLAIPRNRIAYIKKFLVNCEGNNKDPRNEKQIQSFIQKELRVDGIFALWMIERNTGSVFISDLVKELWNMYK